MTSDFFKGKTALITGASAGIGRSTAVLLASLGVKVFAIARRKEKLLSLQKENSLIVPLILDLNADLKPLKELLESESLDILINNAGLALGRDPVYELKESSVDQMIDTNIKALIRVTRLTLPFMLMRKSGDIVNLGSVAGYHAYAGGSVYAATKAAVISLTEAFRLDLLGTGIRVMGIHPGMVETEFSVVRYGGDQDAAKKVYEGMDPLSPEDIAEAIVWTLSRPKRITVSSLVIYPTDQAGVGFVHRRNSPSEESRRS